MKHLRLFDKEIDYKSAKDALELPWVSYVEEINKVFYMYSYKPNTSVYYKIEDNTLYIRGTKQEGYSERVLYTDATLSKNGWYSASNKAQITKAVIEEVISPTSCVRFFDGMSGMTTIENIENLKMDNATDLSAMFQNCNVLTSIGDISDWNVGNVTSMRVMFNNCNTLASVGDLSNWNVANVTNMSSMFNSNDPSKPLILKSIGDISRWNVSNVTDMSYMFRGCTSLNELNLSSWNTSKVTTMYEAFSNFIAWTKYTDFSIPKINIPPIPKDCNVDHAFSFDYSLTTIESSGKISKSLNFQWSPLTHDSAMVLINALDSENVGTLTLSTATKETLTEEEIAIATGKGWTIAAA